MACWQILIVDSDPPAALTTQHGLQRLLGPEATVLIAPSPGAAWLRCMRQRVDLLIVDPTPQNLAAMALIKAVRGDQPQTAIMVLAAYDTPGLRHQMKTFSIRHYQAKPILVSELAAAVRVAVRMSPVGGDLPSAATEQG
jgi:two-component system, OmpR family, response regulator